MLDGDLVLGPVTGAYYSLFQKEMSNIPTVTPSLFIQTRRITRHNATVTRYKSAINTTMTGRQPVYIFFCRGRNYRCCSKMDGWMDELLFYVFFNSISIILG